MTHPAPQPFRARRRATRRSQRGFALLVTITLLAFLVILLVALASLTKVETQLAANTQQLAAARANALLALNVALGQLQKEAGPDQRITARADILDTNPTTPASEGVTQPLWTGVWATGNNPLDINPNINGLIQRQVSFKSSSTTPTRNEKISSASWLISNPTPATPFNPTNYSGTTTGDKPDAVELARNLGASQDINITVPLVSLSAIPAGFSTPQTIGRYGYWVADEGIKAKVNISDPTAQKTYTGGNNLSPIDDLPKNLLHFMAPQSFAAHKILPDELAKDFRSAPGIDQVLTPQQLPMLPTTAPSGYVAQKYAPDITTYSYGIFSDVRNGGLKKDLTAAFEDNGNTPGKNYAKLNPDGRERVYRAPIDTVPIIPNSAIAPTGVTQGLDGLRWINLFTYYNLYKATFPSINMGSGTRVTNNRVTVPGYVPAGVGNPRAAARPYGIAPRGHAWTDTTLGANNGNVSFGVLAPVVLGLRWDVSVSSNAVPGGWTLNLNYYPQLILYNPYAVTLHASLNNFRMSKALAAAGNFYLETTVGTGASARTYFTMINQASTLQRLLFIGGFDDMQTFKPGEMRVFGLHSANSGLQTDSSINISNYYYTKTTSGKETALTLASEVKDTVAPYGMLSRGFSSTLSRSAAIQFISTYGAPGANPSIPDTYSPLPAQPAGTAISIRLLSARPGASNVNNFQRVTTNPVATISGSGSSDNSIPRAVFWPTDTGQTGSVLNGITGITGAEGRRYGQGGIPGSISTGNGGNIPGKPPLTATIDSLGETQVLSIYTRKKGINTTGGTSYSNASLAVPYFSGNSTAFNVINDFNGSRYWDEFYIASQSGWPSYGSSSGQAQTGLTPSGHTTSSWGDRSMGDAPAPDPYGSRIVLADIPIQPMLSLGQFMHLQQHHIFSVGNYTNLGFGSMFVGGSLPSPEVPTNQNALDNGSTLLLDHSFLANQALFDRYYFSTFPPSGTAPAGTTWPEQWTQFNDANKTSTLTNSTIPLLNRRIAPIYTNGQSPAMTDLRDMDKAAAHLLLNGAFNINSTSVNAWRALLSSLSGNDLSLWDATTESDKTYTSGDLLNPISRFWSSNGGNDVNTLWSGVRALTDAEITNLASEIVTQVKTRGPFLSMSDFLNRRLGNNSSALSRAGTLQAAIDRTNLNEDMKLKGVPITSITGSVVTGPNNSPPVKPIPENMYDASSSAGAPWRSTIGAPGYLMQQDLVQAFSPVMNARSDTFTIRTYGETVNPVSDKAEGKAWLEAIVQRLPEYINPSTDAAEIYPPTNSANNTFGRRFKIISLRWLSSNEI